MEIAMSIAHGRSISQSVLVSKTHLELKSIIEFHNKSVKYITLNSKRDRIDQVVVNLLLAKTSKRRQFEILLSRKKAPLSKVTKCCRKRFLSEDRWSKRGQKKQFAGLGFFQKKSWEKNLKMWKIGKGFP